MQYILHRFHQEVFATCINKLLNVEPLQFAHLFLNSELIIQESEFKGLGGLFWFFFFPPRGFIGKWVEGMLHYEVLML